MKKLTVLGVTGSIGTQTVDVVLHHQDQFEIVAMSAGHNINKLEEIMAKLPVKHICVLEEKDRAYLEKKYPDRHCHYRHRGGNRQHDGGFCSLDNHHQGRVRSRAGHQNRAERR